MGEKMTASTYKKEVCVKKARLGQVCQFVNSGNEEKSKFEDTK